ncbi:MAG: class I SAM-dependent methyltransferase [Phycisphaerales bacterium]|nr:class I SAM-dependent methyltransferase [Phycisphaerales bacterium]
MPHDGRMTFIDILSLDNYVEGQPWDGYAQFCREFLYPLMLTAYKGIDFQPWLRAYFSGISASDFNRVLAWRERFRAGVFKHVYLNSRLERSFAKDGFSARASFASLKLPKSVIENNVNGLKALVRSLPYDASGSVWHDYEETHSYQAHDDESKAAFVREALGRLSPKRVVDIGCNTGRYSLLAAEQADQVIAMDYDPACINRLYNRCKSSQIGNITVLVGDLLNPTPSMGWRLTERSSIMERATADSFLALALVHHICIGGNVPVQQFVDQLAHFAKSGVVEWVDKRDAMVQHMLRNRVDVFGNYTWESFEAALTTHFDVLATRETHDGARRLCLVGPKADRPTAAQG